MDTYRNGKSGCGQGENLVSYAYGELNDRLKADFEAHLRGCDSCPEELAGISEMRFAVQDWKSVAFDPLVTPAFELPAAPVQVPEVSIDVPNKTWLSAIRNLFTLSPAWSLAAASVAVVALGAATILLMSGRGGGGDIAGANKVNRNGSTVSSASPEKSIVPQASPATPTSSEKPTESAQKNDRPTIETPADNPNPRVVRVATRPDSTPRTKTDVKKPVRNVRNRAPEIDGDDEDADDSLRLSELFDEIDTD